MIEIIKDTKTVASLFEKIEVGVVCSCLQGTMGKVYANTSRSSAVALLGNYSYLAGAPDEELVSFKPKNYSGDFIVMTPPSAGWDSLIERRYKDRAAKRLKYSLKQKAADFNRLELQKIAANVPRGCAVKMIDEKIFSKCMASRWCRDLVGQYPDFETYREKGLGVVILKGEEIISGASSFCHFRGGVEVQTNTKEKYKRRGLASICCARFILECLERNLSPMWDAQHKGSLALAKKLGYLDYKTYTAYEISGY